MKKIIFLIALMLGTGTYADDMELLETVCKDIVSILEKSIAKEEDKLAKLNMRILIECLDDVQKPSSDAAIKKCFDEKKRLYDIPTGESL